jgi:PKD domain
LRDVSGWVEKGVAPPASTSYKVVDGQVQVPPTAAERRGIQPIITVSANGGARAEVALGQPVTFSATIEVPSNTGRVISATWDFEGAGNFPDAEQLNPSNNSGTLVKFETTHTFAKSGTYFPTLRVASQRQGDSQTPYTRIQNLGRLRVAVK